MNTKARFNLLQSIARSLVDEATHYPGLWVWLELPDGWQWPSDKLDEVAFDGSVYVVGIGDDYVECPTAEEAVGCLVRSWSYTLDVHITNGDVTQQEVEEFLHCAARRRRK